MSRAARQKEKTMKTLFLSTMVLLATVALGQQKNAVGTWKLDTAQSIPPGSPSMTLIVTKDSPDTVAYSVSGTDESGKPFEESFSAARGEEAPVTGREGTKIAFGKDNTYHQTSSDGTVQDMKYSVSEDGQTMTVTGTRKSKDGKESPAKEVWKKVSQ